MRRRNVSFTSDYVFSIMSNKIANGLSKSAVFRFYGILVQGLRNEWNIYPSWAQGDTVSYD